MLKLICPHCMKSVSVPEQSAGQDTPCPECGKPFPVPARYYPMVAPPPPVVPPPPPRPSEAPVPNSAPPIDSAPLPVSAGYTHSRGITLSPAVIEWIPAVSIALIFLLSFFSWVGVYPNGHPVYSEGAWRAISGYPQRSIQLEELLLNELPPPSVYDRTSSDWLIMLPYVLALILATIAAWAERLRAADVQRSLPSLWPFRHAMIAVLAGATLLLLAVESARGFGLERAMQAAIADKFEAERNAAKTPGDLEKVNFHQQQELNKYNLERTGWFDLAVCLHVIVLFALAARIGLERRGNKPPPRIIFQY